MTLGWASEEEISVIGRLFFENCNAVRNTLLQTAVKSNQENRESFTS